MRTIHHDLQGQDNHDLCIYLAERMLTQRGYVHLDKRWWKDKANSPGVPDIYVEKWSRGTNERGMRIDICERKVIEIESKLTKKNKEKKEQQFRGSVKGTEIIIINLAENKDQDSISKTIEFLDKYLPG
jgi:hypothetical protein